MCVCLEYAAAFFLLADDLKGCVGVLWSQVGDAQLAIAVARVYEGDGGPVLKALLEEKVLAAAAEGGNGWLACWAFWMLGRRDEALRALTVSLRRGRGPAALDADRDRRPCVHLCGQSRLPRSRREGMGRRIRAWRRST